jgi:hypothetical protein
VTDDATPRELAKPRPEDRNELKKGIATAAITAYNVPMQHSTITSHTNTSDNK